MNIFVRYESFLGDQNCISVRSLPNVSEKDYLNFLDNIKTKYQSRIYSMDDPGKLANGTWCCILILRGRDPIDDRNLINANKNTRI
jgi:hypothetical protein